MEPTFGKEKTLYWPLHNLMSCYVIKKKEIKSQKGKEKWRILRVVSLLSYSAS